MESRESLSTSFSSVDIERGGLADSDCGNSNASVICLVPIEKESQCHVIQGRAFH